VSEIVVSDNVARGVIAGGQTFDADVVISGADPKTTLLRLVDPSALSPDFASRIQHYRANGTVAKVNLALAQLPEFVSGASGDALTGRIQIGSELDYLERAFDHVKYGEISAQPWLELTIPSLLDPALAPSGAHVASVYVHYAPRTLRSLGWSEGRDLLLKNTLDVLERHAPRIRSSVVAAQVISPCDIETEYGSSGGQIFHGEMSLDQIFTMRPLLGTARYVTPVTNLYLCSAGTHPGGFMSGGSGRLAAEAVLSNHRT
jgi:phytoene dehydrogenase-like protein